MQLDHFKSDGYSPASTCGAKFNMKYYYELIYSCTDVARFLKDLSSQLIVKFREVPLEKVFLRKDVEFEHMEKQFKRMMRNAHLFCQSNICK